MDAMRLPIAALGVIALACLGPAACSDGQMPPDASATPPPFATVIVSTPIAPTAAPTNHEDADRTPSRVSLDWLDGDGLVPDLPSPFAAPRQDAGLRAVIDEALAGFEGSVSVVVHNLLDGRSAALNENRVYYAASTYKMSLLYEAYRQVESGERDLDDLLTLEQKYVEYDLGTLDLLGLHLGDQITLGDALRAMIIVSDTPTAVLVQDTLGADRVDATLRTLGLTETEFNNRDLPATARDMARLLEAIAGGEGVSDQSRLAMLALLVQEQITGGVVSGIPEGVAVAHKTGNLGSANHDIALVWGPAGPYIIAVMTDTLAGWDPVFAVSAAVWRYFAENP